MENKKSNPVGWFEIYVDNMERATKFYESVFKTKLENMGDPTNTSFEMKSFPGNNEGGFGTTGSLVQMDGVKAGGNSVFVYFTCEDCATEESRVEAAGGEIFKSKFSIGEHGFCSLVSDTEGNMIGLHSMK